jgi:glutaredoxin-dependent peroxiredoxin
VTVSLNRKVPGFSLPDSQGKVRNLDEFLAAGPTVIAFFPFAFSGVCDREMCSFRDGLGSLTYPRMQLVGISVDSHFALRAFATTYNLQFPLLSDFNKKVSKLYGVLQDPWVGMGYRGVAKRSVMVVDRRGVLRYKWVTDNPGTEPPYEQVYGAVQKCGP